MALEEGELPSAAAPADYQALSLEAAEAGFYRYFDRVPEGVRYVDRYGSKYDSGAAGDEGRSRIFVHTERDRRAGRCSIGSRILPTGRCGGESI